MCKNFVILELKYIKNDIKTTVEITIDVISSKMELLVLTIHMTAEAIAEIIKNVGAT